MTTTEPSATPYQMCTRCVMDTSDPDIEFDADGVCSHCTKFDTITRAQWHPDAEGERLWSGILDQVRADGKDREYDCILGLSGGLDSSLLAVRAKDWGLRVLAVHVDAGWNTELAVHNIERLVEFTGFDLYTHVVDWADMRELQLSFLRSGIANQDVPQDHVFFAALYREATRRKIRFVLSGGNIATESVFPANWHGSAMDAWNLKAIHRKFGTTKLKSYPTMGFLRYYLINPYVRRMRVLRPLNYMPYDRAAALAELQERVGYTDYGLKHGESQFTRFFQNHYLPERFGYDKRRPHFASMILSDQITREEALEKLDEPLYDTAALAQDKAYFIKKLRISADEFEGFLNAPLRTHREFRNQVRAYEGLKKLQRVVERLTRRDLGAYG
jgi:aminotransferase